MKLALEKSRRSEINRLFSYQCAAATGEMAARRRRAGGIEKRGDMSWRAYALKRFNRMRRGSVEAGREVCGMLRPLALHMLMCNQCGPKIEIEASLAGGHMVFANEAAGASSCVVLIKMPRRQLPVRGRRREATS